jgi:hypothetical protein
MYLDGVVNGTTPKILTRVPSGGHTLRLTSPGYLDDTSPVTVTTAQTTAVSRVLTPIPIGSISVSSTPSYATIYLDGVYNGTTPRSLTGIPAGDHTLHLTNYNYLDDVSTVTVLTGQTTPVLRVLTGIGTAYIISTPSGATIYLDDVINGTTPKTIYNVTSGPFHTIRLTKTGYLDDVSSCTVTTGGWQSVYRTLIKV